MGLPYRITIQLARQLLQHGTAHKAAHVKAFLTEKLHIAACKKHRVLLLCFMSMLCIMMVVMAVVVLDRSWLRLGESNP